MLQTTIAPWAAALGLLLSSSFATAPFALAAPLQSGDPISQAIADSDPQVREYNAHLSFLAHDFLGGRLPGTPGMEIAKNYVEQHFIDAGLTAPFTDADGNPSYRQDFPISERVDLTGQSLSMGGQAFTKHTDFRALGVGSGGVAEGGAVFVGYSIDRGRDGYSSYAEGDSLEGKIAIVLRFEPMGEDGWSKWRDGERWSSRAGYRRKVADAVERGAIGVIIVNPPDTADPRAGEELPSFRSGGRGSVDVPVMTMTTEAGRRLLEHMGPQGTTLEDLKREADAGRSFHAMDGRLKMVVETSSRELTGQNICGLVPGKGALADEIVIIGAHLDHLGLGEFGSRSGPGEIHPGADDNASGSAAMIMLAKRFTDHYAQLPDDASARTILIQCYDAEEQGLIGAFYYSRNPMRPIEDHVLMLNFDMIGRITDEGGMSVTGLGSGEGLKDFVQPYLANTSLKLVPGDGVMAASDHWAFHQAGVPTLMGICDPLHADYHTPRDTADKINRVNAVHAMNLWGDICLGVAQHEGRFPHVASPGMRRPRQQERDEDEEEAEEPAPSTEGGGPRTASVRLGVVPGNYDEDGNGVLVSRVTVDSPADEAGLADGDRIMKWNGETLANVRAMSEKLRAHDAGDKVDLEIERDGATKTITVTLEAKE